jgi:hypothetical protein
VSAFWQLSIPIRVSDLKQDSKNEAGAEDSVQAGGYMRVFLKHASQEESGLFTEALHETMGPLRRPRYVIPPS